MKHGKGSDLFSNGDVFVGNYKNGKFDGYGQYIWAEGSIYDGDFRDGLKHGRGKWRKNKNDINSNRYEGEYY